MPKSTHVLRFVCPDAKCSDLHTVEGSLCEVLTAQRRVLDDGSPMAVIYTAAAWTNRELDEAEDRLENPTTLQDVFDANAVARATLDALDRLAKPSKSG